MLDPLIPMLSKLTEKCREDLKNFTAGKLGNCLNFWRKNCGDPSILQLISGLKVPLKSRISNRKIPPKIRFSFDEEIAIRQEITKFLLHNIIEPVYGSDPDEFLSNIFVRAKPDGGSRIILNLKRFNENVSNTHFKMHSLNSAIDLMRKGSFMASVDYKLAYYHVPVHKSNRKYFRFLFDSKKYQFTCLPMGLATGPRDFTKIMKMLFKILREKGHQNTFYIDDSFLIHNTFEGCLKNVVDTVNTSRDAGFTINPEKSVFTPKKELTYLGFVLNSDKMTVRLCARKRSKILSKIELILAKPRPKIQEVAELTGQLVATFPAVPLARLYYRQIDIDKARALKLARGNFQAKMKLSVTSRQDLKWWISHLPSSETVIASKNPRYTLY